jgi:uncharacterized OsmC-like protein
MGPVRRFRTSDHVSLRDRTKKWPDIRRRQHRDPDKGAAPVVARDVRWKPAPSQTPIEGNHEPGRCPGSLNQERQESTMSQTMTRGPLNGVDVPTLFATIDAVDGQRELARFKFRAVNKWQIGTHSRTTIKSFYGAGSEHEHVREFTVDADHPQVLVGEDRAPLPVELLLAALASCIMSGIGNIAAARGVELTSVEASIEGEMDGQGMLGLSDEVRNGYQNIKIDFRIDGNASEEKLRQIVEQSRARSPVFDVITNGTSVDIAINGS